MLRATCFALAVSVAGSAIGQAAVRPEPADPKAGAPVRSYESAFKDYRPYVDPDIARWRNVNDEVGRLNGHLGHVPQQPGTAIKPAAKAPAQGGRGGLK